MYVYSNKTCGDIDILRAISSTGSVGRGKAITKWKPLVFNSVYLIIMTIVGIKRNSSFDNFIYV